jgi:hypothetical protein
VELGLAGRELLGQALALLERREVGRERDGRARAHAGQGVELGAGRRAGFGVAGRDVHLGAVDHEGLRDHAADALGAARDEDDFVLAVLVMTLKEWERGKGVVIYLDAEEGLDIHVERLSIFGDERMASRSLDMLSLMCVSQESISGAVVEMYIGCRLGGEPRKPSRGTSMPGYTPRRGVGLLLIGLKKEIYPLWDPRAPVGAHPGHFPTISGAPSLAHRLAEGFLLSPRLDTITTDRG